MMPSAVWDLFSITTCANGRVKVEGTWDLTHDPSITTLDGCNEIIAGICTAGSRIDELISECQKTSMSKAVMIDQVGTWAVQQVMITLVDSINRTIPEKTARFTPVIRPGFEKWPISNQSLLFSMLDASRIGVKLTTSLLMVPSKSISFIIGIKR
ncbi:MAG: hypothetical protein GYA24_08325 [Candidatus Lokiarchaeota archaeon]|nr:hypothetical protein [Candidatus Lokiarchaeota archaeon]